MGLVVGIDASRNRSGGAKVHLIGILASADPRSFGVDSVHVWSYPALLDSLPNADWLIKHSPRALRGSLLGQLWWQLRKLPNEVKAAGCNILLNTDAGTVCGFHPAVTMSRDMLSYESGEMRRFGLSRARLRLLVLRFIQARSLKKADGVIFLTGYAARVIQMVTGSLRRTRVIPHGVTASFRRPRPEPAWDHRSRKVRCVYVSNTDVYKHQWHVVRAIADLRARGYDIELLLAGDGRGRAESLLKKEILRSDPDGNFVVRVGAVRHADLPSLLTTADLYVFASSCENMPNTLLEGMASGLPIACSDRGPMPEVLGDAGTYFDPEKPASIASAIEMLLIHPTLRIVLARQAEELSRRYSWRRCAEETWAFLGEIHAAVAPCSA
jgi:glycosyltransferase involved in cell wall biosynthesis